MAKIKLRLNSKKDDETNESSPKSKSSSSIATTPTIKLKAPKQSDKPNSSLPKIKFKTKNSKNSNSSNSNKASKLSNEILIPSVKFKTLDETASESNKTSILPGTTISTAIKPKRVPILKVKPVKLPGNAYDSEDPEKEDDPIVEEGIILRFLPDESLDFVRAAVENSEKGLNDDKLSLINVIWKDKRRAVVKVNNFIYAAKLVNLPTISEIHKTIDRKNIFKTIDICQMLLVVKRIFNEDEIFDLPLDKEYGETYPDGLTAPMEFTKDRFIKKYEESVIQNVEDEVERLLKLDSEAESSVFEFIDANEENLTPMSVIENKLRNKLAKKEKKRLRKERSKQTIQTDSVNDIGNNNDMDLDNELDDIDNELDKLMEGNEINDALEGEEDEDDDEEEEEEEEEEEGEQSDIRLAPESEADDHDDDDDDDEEEEEDDDEEEDEEENGRIFDNEGDETKQHAALIMEEITELESTIAQKQKDLNKAINPIMKSRINDVISRLQQELSMKKLQIKDEEDQRSKSDEAGKGEEDDEEDAEEEGREVGEDGRDDEEEGAEDQEEDQEDDDEEEAENQSKFTKNTENDNNNELQQQEDDDGEDDEDEDGYDDLF